MKYFNFFLALLFCYLNCDSYAQTFSNSINTSWNASLTKTISVSGVGTLVAGSNVLKQVNLKLGQSGSGVGSGTSTYFIKLTSPTSGTVVASCTVCPAGGFNSTGVDLINIKYRDNSNLQYPSLTTGSKGAEPWDVGYYKVELTSGGFTNFNGINADGTWTLSITESQVSNGLDFQNVDLVFGAPFSINDITSTTTNDVCSSSQCFDNSSILIAKNQGYTGNNTTDPIVSSPYASGCDWNAANNNTAWFYFRPSGNTSTITVSGLQDVMQALVINPTFSCTQGSQSVPAGGCPLNNDTYRSARYSTSSGSSANFQFKLSGLTPNSNYYLVIDGTGGNISKFYIELSGGSVSCSTILPIELAKFDYSCHNEKVKLNWITKSEINNSHFTVLGSVDANEWTEVGTINGAGNSNKTNFYEFEVSSQFNHLMYFKLAQQDYDGRITYSNIIFPDCEKNNQINFYPNPFENEIKFDIKSNQRINFEITTVLGQIVNSGVISQENNRILLTNLASDIYFMKINNSKTYKIIKQ